jgi:hypothetical protein
MGRMYSLYLMIHTPLIEPMLLLNLWKLCSNVLITWPEKLVRWYWRICLNFTKPESFNPCSKWNVRWNGTKLNVVVYILNGQDILHRPLAILIHFLVCYIVITFISRAAKKSLQMPRLSIFSFKKTGNPIKNTMSLSLHSYNYFANLKECLNDGPLFFWRFLPGELHRN